MSPPASSRWPLCGLAGLLLLAPVLGGCGVAVTGNWHMVEVVPNKEMFCIDNASFRRDGTYSATTTFDGKTTDETGRYKFNGFKLILRPEGGGQRSYTAYEQLGRLHILDEQRKVVLRKD